MTIKSFFYLLLTISCTVCGQVLMKKGLNFNSAVTIKNIATNYHMIAGIICYIGSFTFWLNVLRLVPLSVAYPSASLSYALVIAASAVFLNEQITSYKVIGIIFIITGVFFISRPAL